MKKPLLFFFLIYNLAFIIYNSSSAQQITFQKTYGGASTDFGTSIHQTSDGGYIVEGTTVSFGAGGSDVYLTRINAVGDTAWTKTYGGLNYDKGFSIQQTVDGGYIVVGSTISFGAGNDDVYLVKTDSMGNTLWSKTYGGTASDEGYSVQQTTDEGYIITGRTNSFGAGDYDIYLIKTDSIGSILWAKTYRGAYYDDVTFVQQTTDSGYIILGYTVSFGAGYEDVYLIKTDANGDTLWTKTYGGINQDQGYSVQQTTDGGYIVTGYTRSFGTGNEDVYLIKTDATGDTLWTKTYGGIHDDIGYSVRQTSDSGYIVVGSSASFGPGNSDVYLIKTDANGDTLWTKTYRGIHNDIGYSVQQTTDGGYVVAGWTYSFGVGILNVYLIKTDSLGISGCNEEGTATIVTRPNTIIKNSTFFITSPTTIFTTPATQVGSGGTVTALCASTGITFLLDRDGVRLFPNPANDNLQVTMDNLQCKNIEIKNILSQSVLTQPIVNRTSQIINISSLSSGIYFIAIQTENGALVKKFVKE